MEGNDPRRVTPPPVPLEEEYQYQQQYPLLEPIDDYGHRIRSDRRRLSTRSGAEGGGYSIGSSSISTSLRENARTPPLHFPLSHEQHRQLPSLSPSYHVSSASPSNLPKSFIADATDNDDLEAIKEGLHFALGTNETGANWFPVKTSPEKNADRVRGSSIVDINGQDASGYAENIPLTNVKVKLLQLQLQLHLSPFLTTESNQIPYSGISNINASGSRSGPGARQRNMSLKVNTDLEAGSSAGLVGTTPFTPSSQKFSDVFNRLSERIAAKSSVTPTADVPPTMLGQTSLIKDAEQVDTVRKRQLLPQLISPVSHSPTNIGYFPEVGTSTNGLGLYIDSNLPVSTAPIHPEDPESYAAILREQDEPILQQMNPLRQHRTAQSSHTNRTKGSDTVVSGHEGTATPPTPTDGNSMYLFGNSLLLFSPQSKVRQICFKILDGKIFNWAILYVLFLQVALLSYRQWNPDVLHGYFYNGYNWADWILVGINIAYTVEVIMKSIAYGFYDDHIMYEQCGLQYPEGQMNWRLNFDMLRKILENLGLLKAKNVAPLTQKTTRGKKAYINPNLSDIKEINLDDPTSTNNSTGNPISNLKQKYRLSLHHEEKDEIPGHPSTIRNNTFVLNPKRRLRLDMLHLKRAFIRSSWHRIDFLSMIMFWISFILSYGEYDTKHSIYIFRSLSCLRILRLTNLTTGTSTILTAVKLALPQLFDVSLFIVCFWFFFGIIGVQSFKSSLTRQCVWTNPDDPTDQYNNTDQYCGSYLNASNLAPMPYINRDGTSSTSIKGYRCPQYSQCISMENPYGGTLNFDNIFQSMEIVFVIMTANTFTDIMYYTTDTDSLAAVLFFVATIFVMTVWLLNIFIAVIFNSFSITRMQQEQERLKHGTTGFKIFGSVNEKVSMHTDRIKFLKSQNIFLKLYYRFEFIWILLICADLFVQCFRLDGMNEEAHHTLYRLEVVFTVIFLVEIGLRFAFHFPHWRLFFILKRNCFDLFLAAITSIIVIGPVKDGLGQAYYWLTCFQIMRFYRVVLSTKFTRNLWLDIMKDFKTIFDLAMFYFILVFLSSIIVARFFEGTIPPDQYSLVEFPFHTLPNVFISLYVIASTENWTSLMYPLAENATNVSSRCFGSMILILWFIVANFVVLNLFIAVIAHSLEVSEFGKRKQQLLQFIDNMTNRLQNMDSGNGVLSKVKNKLFKKLGNKDELEKAVVNLLLSGTAVKDFLEDDENDEEKQEEPIQAENSSVKTLPTSRWKRWIKVNFWRTFNFLKNPFYTQNKFDYEISNFEPAAFAKKFLNDRNKLISQQNKFLEENPKFNNVFYIMTPRHRIRRFCQKIVKSSFGERIDGVEPNKTVQEVFVVVMFMATIGLVVTACYLTPLLRDDLIKKHGVWNWSAYLETAFTVFFSSEFFIKILADGFLFTPNAYTRSVWNLLDLIVLIALWIELIAFLRNDGNLSRIVRGLKALRALRLLTISETAKSNFHNTMISGFGKIINAGIVSIGLLLPFSIWGLNIFNGRLGYCIDGASDIGSCFNEYQNQVFNWDVLLPNVWTEPELEFNRFVSSFSSLFQIISLEGWVDLLENVMKLTGVGTAQQDYAQPYNGIFVVFFNFVSTIFILTLFVSVIIVNYSKTTGRAYLTSEQVSWYQVKGILLQVKASKRKTMSELKNNWFRRLSYNFTVEKNTYWQMYLNLVLFLHVISLFLETFPAFTQVNILRSVIFTLTAASFSVNAAMLMLGQGFSTFFHYKWNVFYLIVSWGALICTIIGFFISQQNAFININKLFLVGILFFIIPRSNRLSQLLRFASASLPTLLSLSFTWGVVFLMFAIALNQIFGVTKIGPNGTDNLNLRSVPKALTLLFRCSFGEGWNYVMVDYALQEPFCTSTPDGITDCGNKQYAYILFITWNLTSMYIFLNMFVSLILDSFSYINNTSSYIKLIQRDELRSFKASWQKFDEEGTGYIKPIDLPKFLHSLDGALSFHFYTGSLEIKLLCKEWFIRNNPFDPYDVTVKHDAINETLESLDIPKIRARRRIYEMFVEEALLTMELNNSPGISFTLLLLQLPLYIAFDSGTCLNLIDFLERRLLLQKVEKRLKIKRVYDIMTTYAVRWKYQKDKRLGIEDSNIEFGKKFRRNSYFENPDLMENKGPSVFVTDEDSQHSRQLHEPSPMKPNLNNPFKTEMNDMEGYNFNDGRNYHENVYEPASPVQLYKSTDMRNRLSSSPTKAAGVESDNHPSVLQLFVKLPQSAATSPNSGTPGFQNPVGIELTGADEQASNKSDASFIDIALLGEELQDTQWGEALRQVQSEHKSENSKEQ